MELSQWLNIAFGGFTVAGFLVAWIERGAKKKVTQMYKQKCAVRCKQMVTRVAELSDSSTRSCMLVHQLANPIKRTSETPLGEDVRLLTGHLYAVRSTTNRLIDFCNELNEEFKYEFGEPILNDMDKELPRKICPESFRERDSIGSRLPPDSEHKGNLVQQGG